MHSIFKLGYDNNLKQELPPLSVSSTIYLYPSLCQMQNTNSPQYYSFLQHEAGISTLRQLLNPSLLPPSFSSISVPSGLPQGLAVANRTSTSITLTWRDPAPDRINDRDGITRFVVRRNGQQVANITGWTYTFTGLSVATSYNFEVLAINEQGIAPNNHAARLTATTASESMYSTQMELSVSVSLFLPGTPPLQSLASTISCSAQPPSP